jgi:hypothetical protein
MEPEQPAPNRNQNWQRALDPQLTGRLLRPLVQPGVISPNLGRNILSRMQRTGANMPLLDKALGYMRSIDDPQATRVPIVYARPVLSDRLGETSAVPDARPVVHPAVVQRAVAGVSGSEDLPASATVRLGGVADPAPRAAPATELPEALTPPERSAGMPVFVPPPGAGGRDLPAAGMPIVIARSAAAGIPTVIARSVAPGAGGHDLPPAESPTVVVPSSPRDAGPAPLNDLIAPTGETPAPQRFVLPAGRRLQRAVDTGVAGMDAPRIAAPDTPAESAVPPLVQALSRAADAAPLPLVAHAAANAPEPRDSEMTLAAPDPATAQAIHRPLVLPGDGVAQPPTRPMSYAISSASGVLPIQRRSAVAGAPAAPLGVVAPVLPIQSLQRPVVQRAAYGAQTRPVVAALPGAQLDAAPTLIVTGRPARAAERGPAMPISSAPPMIARTLDRSGTSAVAPSDTAAADAAPPHANSAPDTPDMDELVDRALRKLMRYIDIESERRGRKPWA